MDIASRDAFLRRKEAEIADGRQRVALRLLVGVDLDDMLGMPDCERDRMTARLKRALERERQRGLRRHWSYDLNRHIALKQALDRLSGRTAAPRVRGSAPPRRKRRDERHAVARQCTGGECLPPPASVPGAARVSRAAPE